MKAVFPHFTRHALVASLLVAGFTAALPAHADRGGRFRGGPAPGRIYAPAPHFGGYAHGGGHWNGWWIVGMPWLLYPPYYNYPPVVVQQPEQPAPLPNLPPTPQNWYYCDSAQAYYPYAQSCPEGWRNVAATPSGSTQAAAPETHNWYYCDSAKGYYPYVQRCPESWRPVPATPAAGPAPNEGVRQQ